MRTPEEVREEAIRTLEMHSNTKADKMLAEYAALLESKPKWKKFAEGKPPDGKTIWLKYPGKQPEICELNFYPFRIDHLIIGTDQSNQNESYESAEWTLAIPPE